MTWPLTGTTATTTLSLGMDNLGEAFRLLAGAMPEEPPRHSVQIDYLVPTLRAAPHKRRGLTGKRYRIARRAYARDKRRWERAGRPMRPERLVLPSVELQRGSGVGTVVGTVIL